MRAVAVRNASLKLAAVVWPWLSPVYYASKDYGCRTAGGPMGVLKSPNAPAGLILDFSDNYRIGTKGAVAGDACSCLVGLWLW